MTTTVSVVIAAYNAREYIGRTLASVESQTRAPDEVVVIDDGSTDNTAHCVEEFKRQSSLNIILERQANKGLAATRNVGVRRSSGDLIAFIDADDVMYPEFLEATVLGLDRYRHWLVCFSDRDVVDMKGNVIAKDLDHPQFQRIDRRQVEQDFWEMSDPNLFCKMVGGNVIPMTIVFRRGSIDAVGGFDEELRYGEDRYFLLGLIKRGGALGYVNRPLGTWQRHEGNLTAPSNALRNWSYVDMIMTKLLANRENWQLGAGEQQCIMDARRAASSSWVYCASSAASRATLPLATHLLYQGRISFLCFLKAVGRYAINGLRFALGGST
jgi:glycosyltransferase involved in cell wall biosynthesis